MDGALEYEAFASRTVETQLAAKSASSSVGHSLRYSPVLGIHSLVMVV